MMADHVFGIQSASTLINHRPEQIKVIYHQPHLNSRLSELLTLAKEMGIACQSSKGTTLDKLAQSTDHQGIVLAINPYQLQPYSAIDAQLATLEQRKVAPLFLLLEHIQNTHNLGAMIRTAEAMGVHGILLTQRQSAAVTAAVQKIATGAEWLVPIYAIHNVQQTLTDLKAKGLWIIGTDCETAKPLAAIDWTQPSVIIMGNEHQGMKALTKTHCDLLTHIPLPGHTQSLNVSVACGMVLYEAMRQRQ